MQNYKLLIRKVKKNQKIKFRRDTDEPSFKN